MIEDILLLYDKPNQDKILTFPETMFLHKNL